MLKLAIILDRSDVRAWQIDVIDRLTGNGFAVEIGYLNGPERPRSRHPADRILDLEAHRFGACLASTVDARPPQSDLGKSQLTIDLTGSPLSGLQQPVLGLAFNGHSSYLDGLTKMLETSELPTIVALLNGQQVGSARPMLSDRLWLSRASNEVLSGAIALIEQTVVRFFAGPLVAAQTPVSSAPPRGFWRHYVPHLAGAVLQRVRRKVATRRPFYWQVAFRHIDGPGVAATGALDGPKFATLPDDGERFYADPFIVDHLGETHLFVEEYPYATGKGVISVSQLGSDGQFGIPRVVLEEPYHLSYPQIISQDGDMFMLPESGGAKRLVLYRAAAFPDRWIPDTVLIDGRDINDATMLKRDGRFWLFATERRGLSSASDTLVVFGADDLRGPWLPHKANPIAIDRSAARPGGAFIERDGRCLLPVQDGQNSYGGGLSLMELLRIDEDAVVFGAPEPVRPGPACPFTGIHTLNRSARTEVIDSAG